MNQNVRALFARLPRWGWGVVVVVAVACGGINRKVEGRLTISQGVYGQMVTGCDVMPCADQPMVGATIALYATDPIVRDGGAEPSPLASTVSLEQGFYELSADAGTYFIVGANRSGASFTPWSRAQSIDVPAGGTVRWDFTSGPGGGLWVRGMQAN